MTLNQPYILFVFTDQQRWGKRGSHGYPLGLESHAGVAKVLQNRLIQRMISAGEKPPTIDPAPFRLAHQRRVSTNETYD